MHAVFAWTAIGAGRLVDEAVPGDAVARAGASDEDSAIRQVGNRRRRFFVAVWIGVWIGSQRQKALVLPALEGEVALCRAAYQAIHEVQGRVYVTVQQRHQHDRRLVGINAVADGLVAEGVVARLEAVQNRVRGLVAVARLQVRYET